MPGLRWLYLMVRLLGHQIRQQLLRGVATMHLFVSQLTIVSSRSILLLVLSLMFHEFAFYCLQVLVIYNKSCTYIITDNGQLTL